jgi:hypothetical protein
MMRREQELGRCQVINKRIRGSDDGWLSIGRRSCRFPATYAQSLKEMRMQVLRKRRIAVQSIDRVALPSPPTATASFPFHHDPTTTIHRCAICMLNMQADEMHPKSPRPRLFEVCLEHIGTNKANETIPLMGKATGWDSPPPERCRGCALITVPDMGQGVRPLRLDKNWARQRSSKKSTR